MKSMSTPISAAVSRSWKVARMALPSRVRLIERVACRDQRQRHREHEQPVPGHRKAPSTSGEAGKGVSIDLATPDHVSCSSVLQRDPGADHHQHGGVDVGAAQPAQQDELDRRAKRDAQHHRQHQRQEKLTAGSITHRNIM